MTQRARLMIIVVGAVLIGLAPAASAWADTADEVAAEAAEEGAHDASGEGHHPISFHEIVAGHEAWQFWGSVVNFLLLVYLVRRMAKQPIQRFLSERKEKIERGIQEAAEAKAKAEAIQREYTERLKTLDQELNKLKADIAEAAKADRARIVAEAEAAAKRVQAETEALILREAEQLERQIRSEVAVAALAAAEQAVRKAVTPDDQRRLAEAFASELGRITLEKRA